MALLTLASTVVSSVAVKAASDIADSLWSRSKSLATELGEDLHHAVFGAFKQAIEQTYTKHSFFSSIIFPNSQIKLDDYYLPLTLEAKGVAGDMDEVYVDSYPGALLNARKDILIVDFAGMGKSTILKYIFLRAVENNVGVPVFIELRKLSDPGQSIMQNILKQLECGSKKVSEKLVDRLISSGGFVFFFDGYDEIPENDRVRVTEDIIEFKRKANKNLYILSSREMPGLNAFKEFYRYNIRPLETQEAYALIKKYSESHKVAIDLIAKLQLESSRPILEFLKNPLLVSLLYRAYEYKKSVPLRKHVFYRQVFEALFDNHDLSKDEGELNRKKKTGLDIHSFELVMRAVGYKTFATSKVEYSKDELLILLEATQKLAAPISFNPQHLLDDLTLAVPLFAVDGTNIRWQHKSLQEYFAALFVSAAGPELQKKVIESMMASAKASSYLNFIALFSDIDPRGGRNIVLKSLLDELIAEFDATKDYPGVNPILAKHRRMLCAGKMHVIANSDTARNLANDSEPPLFSVEANGDPESAHEIRERWNAKFNEILSPCDKIMQAAKYRSTQSVYRHTFPGCVTALSDRTVFLRNLAKSILIGEELDCRFTLNVVGGDYNFDGMPSYFLATDIAADSDEKYFAQINEIIYSNSSNNKDYISFDIDKMINLRSKIEKEIASLSSDLPSF